MEWKADRPVEQVAAIAIVRRGEHFLVGRRCSSGPLAGFAEFPGGKCAPGESPTDTAVRECLEETGLRVRIVRNRAERLHDYPHARLRLFFFDCEPIEPLEEASPRPPFAWRHRDELRDLPFPAANAEVIRDLLHEHPSEEEDRPP